ncbi:MAG: hypothetical protein ACTSU5_16670 [Promethearchaeota archaeon]
MESFWIIDKSGVTLYSQQVGESDEAQLVGSLMTALNQLANEVVGDNCQSVVFGESRLSFTYCPDTGLMLVGRSGPGVKEKNAVSYLARVKEKFLRKFGNSLKCWNGDMGAFEGVEEVVNLKKDKDNWLGLSLGKGASRRVISRL